MCVYSVHAIHVTSLFFISIFPEIFSPFLVPLFLSLTLSLSSALHLLLALVLRGKLKNAPCYCLILWSMLIQLLQTLR